MPVVHVNVVAGRSPEKLAKMAKQVTDAVAQSLDAPVASVRVLVHEIAPEHWFVAGEPKSPPTS